MYLSKVILEFIFEFNLFQAILEFIFKFIYLRLSSACTAPEPGHSRLIDPGHNRIKVKVKILGIIYKVYPSQAIKGLSSSLPISGDSGVYLSVYLSQAILEFILEFIYLRQSRGLSLS